MLDFSISREMSDKSMHAQFRWGFTFAYVKFGQFVLINYMHEHEKFLFSTFVAFQFFPLSLWFPYTRVTHTRPIFLRGMNFKCTNKKRAKKKKGKINITHVTNLSFFHESVKNTRTVRYVPFHLISVFREIRIYMLEKIVSPVVQAMNRNRR